MARTETSSGILSRATHILEETAFEPERFPEALDTIAAMLSARTLALVSISDGAPTIIHGPSAHEMHGVYMEDRWYERDRRNEGYLRIGPTQGQVILEDRFISPQTRADDAFFQDYCRTFDIPWCASWSYLQGDVAWGFTLLRSRRAGRLEADSLRLVELLAGASIRSGMAATRFQLARVRSLADGLEAAGHGALILNEEGVCTFVSASAQACFSEAFGVNRGRLWARDPRASRSLASYSGQMQSSSHSADPASLVIASHLTGRVTHICPIKVAGKWRDIWPGCRTILMVTDISRKNVAAVDGIAAAYGLSGAESRVLNALALGLETDEIARRLSLRSSTVSQYVKSILAKCGCRRRSDLIAMLNRAPLRSQE